MPKRLREILARMASIREELLELEAAEEAATTEEPLDDDHAERVSALVEEFDALEEERAPLQSDFERRERIRSFASNPVNTEHGDDRSAPQFLRPADTRVDPLRGSRSEVRTAALAVLEREHKATDYVSDARAAQIESLINRGRGFAFDGDAVARRLLITESDAYRSAWQKALASAQPAWTPEEANAVNQFRAAEQSLTSASGGYGVPILIDPTVILTSGAGAAPLLGVSRIEYITTTKWMGVSSAGVAFAAEAEGDPIAAQQATFAQPEVTPEKPAAFIPYSFEIEGDYPNFAAEMATLIEQAYLDYLAKETAVGAAGLIGIMTAIDATAGSEVSVTSAGLLSAEDVLKLWNALPERSRARATWFSNVNVESRFRLQGSDNGLFTVDLTAEGITKLNGRTYLTSDYAPAWVGGTTSNQNLAVVGDFSKFVVAQRIGMSVELVPHVFHSDGTPKGQRGWLAWARVGSDSVDDNAFRLLKNP